MQTGVKSLRGDNERKRIEGRDRGSEGSRTRSPQVPGPGVPGANMCQRRRDARPSWVQGPARPGRPLPVHSFWTCGCCAPELRPGLRRGNPGSGNRVGPQPPPRVRAPPRFPPARPPAASAGGGLKARGGPRPSPEPRHPTLRRAWARPSRLSGGPPGSPGCSPPGCPAAAGSLPAPPPQRRLRSPPDQTLSACLRPPSAGRRERATTPPGRPSREPEAGPGGYLDNPAGQPGHLVKSQIRPPV